MLLERRDNGYVERHLQNQIPNNRSFSFRPVDGRRVCLDDGVIFWQHHKTRVAVAVVDDRSRVTNFVVG